MAEPEVPERGLRTPDAAPPQTGSESGRAREAVADPEPCGRLIGRLVDAEGGGPCQREFLVLLASPGNRVAESLHTKADGTFASTRSFPRGVVRAWVTEPGTGKTVTNHRAEFDPVLGEEWLVPVPGTARVAGADPASPKESTLASVHGAVVDLSARPLES